MNKIVSFKKEIFFKNQIEEITSIALEHNYKIEENKILGEFIINGEYKTNDNSEREPFLNKLPFQINLDNKYILDNIIVDIDDFYYELGNNTLIVNIDVLIDKLEEIKKKKKEIINERCIEEETLFNEIENKELYTSYKVYIVREEDNIESISLKYNISSSELEKYNDLTEIKVGDKLVIPFVFNEEDK